jgi:translation initiation factor 5
MATVNIGKDNGARPAPSRRRRAISRASPLPSRARGPPPPIAREALTPPLNLSPSPPLSSLPAAGDQFYRYKMPAVQAKIEGRGNGIKTNVVNMVDVAKALARPASHTLKFFGCELGAQTKFDEKSGQCIVNGAHTADTLANHLENYIKRFVQCHSCGNPETVINISKRETIHLKCKACGHVSDVDMRHKLCTFIIKNPPEKDKAASKKDKQMRRAEKEREEEGAALDREAEEEKRRLKAEKKAAKEDGKKSKKEKKEKKEKKKKAKEDDEDKPEGGGSPGRDSASEPEPESEDDDDDAVFQTDTSAAAMAARAKEQLTDASAAMVTVADDLEKKAKLEEEAKARAAAEEDSSSEEEEDERIAKLRGYISKHDAKETAAYLVGEKLGVESKELGIHFLVEALFDEDEPLAPQVKARKAFLVEAVGGDAKLQTATLCAIELYVTETAPNDFKKLVAVLKELYENDVVEEEAVLAWGADPRAAKKFGVDAKTGEAVRKQAKPFIEWLQQSDDDSDEE